MSKKRVRLADYRERKMAGAIEIETDDGQVFTIPPAELWSDEVRETLDLKDRCKAILGAEEYDRFIAAGGSATLLNAIYADREQLDLGEAQASSPS